MISHAGLTPNSSPLHVQNQVKMSLLEVALGLIQPLHPVLDLQIDLRLLNMVPNLSP